MKNHKGEIATLLTLGLVLIGGLVTLATSFIINRQKNIASNPRASTVNCVFTSYECILARQKGDCPSGNYLGASCTQCKNGKYRCPGTTEDSPNVTPIPTGKVGSGNQWSPDPTQGYNTKLCSATGLPFACCVQYNNQCNDEKNPSYTFYGCTGQPCGNTKISQSNGPGKLVACPSNIGKDANKKCAATTPASTVNNCLARNSQYQYRDYQYQCRSSSLGCASNYSREYGASCANANQICCKKRHTLTPTAGVTSGKGSGATCYPPSEPIHFGSAGQFTDTTKDLTNPVSCGGVVIYDKPDGTVLRECGETTNSTCKYTCFNEAGEKLAVCAVGGSNVIATGTRKMTVINDLEEDIEIIGLITNKNRNYPIEKTFISSKEPNNYLTFDFSKFLPDCGTGAGSSTITLTIQYRKMTDETDVWSQSFQKSDTCQGWLWGLARRNVNILIKLSP